MSDVCAQVQVISSDSEMAGFNHINGNQPSDSEPISEDGLPSISQAQELLFGAKETDEQLDIFAIIKGHLRGLRKLKATPAILRRLMRSYDKQTMEPIPPILRDNEKEHIFVVQDESIFHANDQK